MEKNFSTNSSLHDKLKSTGKYYPQPTPETHPTLLKDGEVMTFKQFFFGITNHLNILSIDNSVNSQR